VPAEGRGGGGPRWEGREYALTGMRCRRQGTEPVAGAGTPVGDRPTCVPEHQTSPGLRARSSSPRPDENEGRPLLRGLLARSRRSRHRHPADGRRRGRFPVIAARLVSVEGDETFGPGRDVSAVFNAALAFCIAEIPVGTAPGGHDHSRLG